MNISLRFDHLAAADADAKAQTPRPFQFRVHRAQSTLYRKCAGQRVGRGIESRQHRAPVRRRDLPVSFGDSGGDQLEVLAQGLPGRLFVQAVVAGDIRVQDRGCLALQRSGDGVLAGRTRGRVLFQIGE